MAHETFLRDKGYTNDRGDFYSKEALADAASNNYVTEMSDGSYHDFDTGFDYDSDGNLEDSWL